MCKVLFCSSLPFLVQDEKAIRQTAIKQFPMLKGASGFEYGYKLVDPKNPKAAMSGSGVVKVCPFATTV